ncbi:DsbA family protein [Pseudomonas sp. HN2-3]|uniref:DsbA family oxidoreductase n=1 Tax=Pseudomonas sp. HN2-3 TaxID=2886360 RepID=UPI001D1181A5|nr:DsbA family protein [Pseudomonas sp. HN2-3]UDU83129.1 DsbA family protein [Pseudomonas sp. HN2-3]
MKNEISLVFDFLDPWGWVAERRLQLAMRKAGVTDLITYLPCRTSLSRKAVGNHFGTYQQLRFGSQATIYEKRLIAEASSLGLALDSLNVETIPDPWIAMLVLTKEHRHAPALFEAIYGAIFRDGRDVGDPHVMAELLQSASSDITMQALSSDSAVADELLKREYAVAHWSHNLTPCIRIGESIVSGAQPPSILERLLMASASSTAAAPSRAVSSAGRCVTRNIVER